MEEKYYRLHLSLCQHGLFLNQTVDFLKFCIGPEEYNVILKGFIFLTMIDKNLMTVCTDIDRDQHF